MRSICSNPRASSLEVFSSRFDGGHMPVSIAYPNRKICCAGTPHRRVAIRTGAFLGGVQSGSHCCRLLRHFNRLADRWSESSEKSLGFWSEHVFYLVFTT
jgi:hypothetical protein